MRYKENILFLFFLYASWGIFAQDSTKVKKVKILPVPTFGYEPETKTKIGAVSLFTLDLYQDSITRSSNADIEVAYTWRNQLIFDTEWDYFFKAEKWFSKGVLHYSQYPDYYYGIGAETPESNEIQYESTRINVDLSLLKNIRKKVFIGGGIQYTNYQNIEIIEADLNPYNELKDANNFGIKATYLKDSRNNLLNTSDGVYYWIESAYNTSSENYLQLKLDLRRYFTHRQKHVFAFRFYNMLNFDTPPFYGYALMGGDKHARGYFLGRFRNLNLSTLQGEYRTPMLWRIGGAIHAGISSNYASIENFTNTFLINYGGGIRFLMDKEDNINLRIDYALGQEGQSGFYISFGESF